MTAPPQDEMRAFAEAVFATAKSVLLAQGDHAPTFVLKGTKGSTIIMLADGLPDDHAMRARVCYGAGRQVMPMNKRRKEIGTLQYVAFAAEAWAIVRAPTRFDPTERPRDAADRSEVIVCTVYDLATDTQREWTAEMLRTAGGDLHDLLPMSSDEGGIISNRLLEQFVAGWRGEEQ